MAGEFFARMRQYYLEVASVLRGESSAASIFPNPTDIGSSRERVYAEFLKQHAPSKCNVFYGGFLFGADGEESGQIDLIVTTDTAPQFNLHNRDGHGKSFSPVDGTLGVASIKPSLNKQELHDALRNIANIPNSTDIEKKVSPLLKLRNYDDWPYKIIYASDGISHKTAIEHIHDFYAKNPDIPVGRRPNLVHVAGKYVIFRVTPGMELVNNKTRTTSTLNIGDFIAITEEADLHGIWWALEGLQQRASASTHILFSYDSMFNRMIGLH